MKRILIVDDEPSVHYAFEKVLSKEYEIHSVETLQEAYSKFEAISPHLVLLDLKLPDGNGIEFLKNIKKAQSEIPVIVITAFADTESAIYAMKEAFDYLAKPFDINQLKELIRKALSSSSKDSESLTLQANLNCPAKIVGKSKAILEVSKLVGQIANTDIPVLIMGESGCW